jgi:allantoinase
MNEMNYDKIDVLIKNGLIFNHDGKFEGDLAIKGEKIAGRFVSGSIKAAEKIIDARGKLILPGIIDSHVHFNEPGREEWEGFETGSKSAAAGGITTVIDMPLNSSPCTLNRKELKRKIEIGEKKSIVDFGLWGGATPGNLDALEDANDR